MRDQPSGRETLLHHNAGVWDGTFIRLDAGGRELERFGSHLQVVDRAGTIHADLTNTSTGVVRSMQFSEPPTEMQISAEGHWSLGPDRIGPWPWVCELCLVWGDRRRRVVVRHNSHGLESLVLVCEARPGASDEAPAAPLQITPQDGEPGRQRWVVRPPADCMVTTMVQRLPGGSAEAVGLQWQAETGVHLQLWRRYSDHGLLLEP